MLNKPEYLVVDTSAFIQNAPVQDMGKNILSIQEVINEITSKRQLRRLIVLPYDLKVSNVFPENISFITEFSKKTGDYPSLSATDIKVMALTYQMEKEHVGTDHLKTTPAYNKVVSLKPPQLFGGDSVGFFKGSEEKETNKTDTATVESSATQQSEDQSVEEKEVGTGEKEQSELSAGDVEDSLELDFSELKVSDVLQPLSDDEYISEEDNDGSEEEDDDDDSDWITPENIGKMKQQMNFGLSEDKPVTVACLTTDFAMQNVLKQIGLNVVGLDGRVIKHLRTYIFRCYACFKTTSNMTKVFCPKCGNKTLKKVAVSVDENGKQVIHINPRKPLTARGKKFSLPKPQGGKHANNPILCEDQPVPDQRPTRLARTKTNPLDEDYIAGFSPFVMRDVNSKSAMLGIRGKNQEFKYWMRKNPNEVVKHRRKKK
ncbi:RNA-binding protein NOB1 [Homalodisca vitripennis]|uniref:RNA-binding protein NOB1 n=1 Tax=Homalodisca vitripennis TaxID=197043 RepID=UPI001EEC63B1|nr:RNA-binding protein NOB1 [Homalodisca vitripennis]